MKMLENYQKMLAVAGKFVKKLWLGKSKTILIACLFYLAFLAFTFLHFSIIVLHFSVVFNKYKNV